MQAKPSPSLTPAGVFPLLVCQHVLHCQLPQSTQPDLASPLLSGVGKGLPLHPWHDRTKHGLAANDLSVSLFEIPGSVLPAIYLNVLPLRAILPDL